MGKVVSQEPSAPLVLALHNKMKAKIIIFFIAILTAASVAAGGEAAVGEFFNKATQYAKERDFRAFKTLYCSKPPETLGTNEYFENKKKIFSNLKLTSRQQGLFDNIQYDMTLYLCSHTKNAKDICMVQPVINKDNRLCIINVMDLH